MPSQITTSQSKSKSASEQTPRNSTTKLEHFKKQLSQNMAELRQSTTNLLQRVDKLEENDRDEDARLDKLEASMRKWYDLYEVEKILQWRVRGGRVAYEMSWKYQARQAARLLPALYIAKLRMRE